MDQIAELQGLRPSHLLSESSGSIPGKAAEAEGSPRPVEVLGLRWEQVSQAGPVPQYCSPRAQKQP